MSDKFPRELVTRLSALVKIVHWNYSLVLLHHMTREEGALTIHTPLAKERVWKLLTYSFATNPTISRAG